MRLRNFWISLVVVVLIVAGALVVSFQKKTETSSTVATTNDSSFVPTYPCTAGGTALAALQAKYPVDTKDSSFGKQVMAIDQISPNDKQFWAFYIDGQTATVGADTYPCKGTEAILWKLESF